MIEIYLNGKAVEVYLGDELIAETETTAHIAYVLEDVLTSLGYNVEITDSTDEESPEEYDEPYYEPDPLDEIED